MDDDTEVPTGRSEAETEVRRVVEIYEEFPDPGQRPGTFPSAALSEETLSYLNSEEARPIAEAQAPAAAPRAIAYTLDELRDVRFPARLALLRHGQEAVMREGDLWQLFGDRGVGKSYLAASIAVAVAGGRDLLRWNVPEPRGVLYIDGEMPADLIRDRFMEIAAGLGVSSCPRLVTIGADWQPGYLPRMDTLKGQALVEPYLTPDVGLVVIDNASTLFDPEGEKDPEAWQPAQDWLLSLRRSGRAALMVHHANKQGGSRGHSKREDVLSAVLKLSRPMDYRAGEGARFEVAFSKARGFFGAAAEPFGAHYDSGTWVLESGGSTRSPDQRGELKDRVYSYVASAAPAEASKRAVRENVRGRSDSKDGALAELVAEGRLHIGPRGGYALPTANS